LRINAYDHHEGHVTNTTSGPRRTEVNQTRNPAHAINDSHLVEEDLVYAGEAEEPEIISVLPGNGWCAAVGGVTVPLVVWVAEDTGRLYGVAVGDDGLVDLHDGDIEARRGFAGYVNNNNDTEEK
jgi:hypothetical protein